MVVKISRLLLFAMLFGLLAPWLTAGVVVAEGGPELVMPMSESAVPGSDSCGITMVPYESGKSIESCKVRVTLDEDGDYGVALKGSSADTGPFNIFYGGSTSYTSHIFVRIIDKNGNINDVEWNPQPLIGIESLEETSTDSNVQYNSSDKTLYQKMSYQNGTVDVTMTLKLGIVDGNRMMVSLESVNNGPNDVSVGYYIYWDLAPEYDDGSNDGAPVVFQSNGWQMYTKGTGAQTYAINSIYVTPPDHVWAGPWGDYGWDNGLTEEYLPGQAVTTYDSAAAYWWFPDLLHTSQSKYASVLVGAYSVEGPQILRVFSPDELTDVNGYEGHTDLNGYVGHTVPVDFEIYSPADANLTLKYKEPGKDIQTMSGVEITNNEDTGTQQVTATMSVYGSQGGIVPVTIWLEDSSAGVIKKSPEIVKYFLSGPKPVSVYYGTETGEDYGDYKEGETVSIYVKFSAPVTVTGSPILKLNSKGIAHYVRNEAADTLLFEYNVQKGDDSEELDYEGRYALVLNGGAITLSSDSSVNAALRLPEPGDEGSLSSSDYVIIDTERPVIFPQDNLIRDGYHLAVGSPYSAPRVIAKDNRSGHLEYGIDDDTVSTVAAAVYYIEYSAVDDSGNSATYPLKVVVGDGDKLAGVVSDVGTATYSAPNLYQLDVPRNVGQFDIYFMGFDPSASISVTGSTYYPFIHTSDGISMTSYGSYITVDTTSITGSNAYPVTVTKGVYHNNYTMLLNLIDPPTYDTKSPTLLNVSLDETGTTATLVFDDKISSNIRSEWLTFRVGGGAFVPAKSAYLDPGDENGKTVKATLPQPVAINDAAELFVNYASVRDVAGNPYNPQYYPENAARRTPDGTYVIERYTPFSLKNAYISINGKEVVGFFSQSLGTAEHISAEAFQLIGVPDGVSVTSAVPIPGPGSNGIRLNLSAQLPMGASLKLQANHGAVKNTAGLPSGWSEVELKKPEKSSLDITGNNDGIHIDDLVKLSHSNTSVLWNSFFDFSDLIYILNNIDPVHH